MFVDGVIEAFVRRGGRVHEKTRVVTQTILDGRQVWRPCLLSRTASRVSRDIAWQCRAAASAIA